MASLVTLIFLTHPRHNSSRVHSIFFSIGGGFVRAADCEKKIGVLPTRFDAVFDKNGGGVGGVVGVFPPEKFIRGGVWLLLETEAKLGVIRGLMRLVVRERRVGLEMWSSASYSFSRSCDFFFLCVFGLFSPLLEMSSSLFFMLRVLYASLMELNLASASALLEGFLSGCHFTTRDLYALPISERDADFGIPRMLYKFFGDCDFGRSPISKTREGERERKKRERERGGN